MGYPLGSFSRFGHQQRWANERRTRAMFNSMMTRQANAEEHFRKEIALYDIFTQVVHCMNSSTADGQLQINEFKIRLESIRHRHESGRRVYYRKLIDFVLLFCDVAEVHPQFKEAGYENQKAIIEDLAERYLRGENVLQPMQPT